MLINDLDGAEKIYYHRNDTLNDLMQALKVD